MKKNGNYIPVVHENGVPFVQSVGLDFLDEIMSGFKLNEMSH